VIRKLLVANRGEIARRVFRTARRMGMATVAVYSDADRDAPFVAEANEAVAIGGSAPAESYLRGETIVAAALRVGADAVHPGYGFLAEDAAFAQLCEEAGLEFVGPPSAVIARLGSKLEAKRIAAEAGVPTLPAVELDGHDVSTSVAKLGFPLLVKAAAGGGGRGMRVVERPEDLGNAVESARREAAAAFGDGTVFLEPYLSSPRHIEVQVMADKHGRVVHLFERECSIQRRHQKLVEESPSPVVGPELRDQLGSAAVAIAKAAGYVGAGTVEFILDAEGRFHLLEVNTRLQVEHPVTEAVTGLDLVRLQLEVAAGEHLPEGPFRLAGHAIEARLIAEDPLHEWAPSVGRLHRFRIAAPGVRVDSAVEDGSELSVHYDSLLAKVVAHAPARAQAAAMLAEALAGARIHGVTTNRDLLVGILRDAEFLAGRIDTGFLERRPPAQLARPPLDKDGLRLHAAAAALAGERARRASATVLTTLPSGWRNVRSAPARARFTTPTGEMEVAYNPGLSVDGEPIAAEVVAAGPEAVELMVAGVRRRFEVHRVGALAHVDSPLGYCALEEVDPLPEPAAGAPAGSLHANLPGVVLKVLVEAGETVEPGQVLAIVEAMKMEHRVRADAAGTVTEVRVREGQAVAAGEVLAVVER
jgi:propionyl-CoA carboxylase alpha chain